MDNDVDQQKKKCVCASGGPRPDLYVTTSKLLCDLDMVYPVKLWTNMPIDSYVPGLTPSQLCVTSTHCSKECTPATLLRKPGKMKLMSHEHCTKIRSETKTLTLWFHHEAGKSLVLEGIKTEAPNGEGSILASDGECMPLRRSENPPPFFSLSAQ